MKIYTHHMYLSVRSQVFFLPFSRAVFVRARLHLSASSFLGSAESQRCNEHALDAGTNQQLLKMAPVYVLTRIHTQQYAINRSFSHDVTAAILVYQNNETAAILVYQTNPVGVKLFSYVKTLFCSNKFA